MAPTTSTGVRHQSVCVWPARGEHSQVTGSRRTVTMSEADTEGSSEPRSRDVYFTSSESDGPHVVVQSTSEEDDKETASGATMLRVRTTDTPTTDAGTDCTSEGCESVKEVDVSTLAPELVASLIQRVETCFSDCCLAKDLFLLKHVKRHRNGFVSIKLLASYKKIKSHSCDWRVLAAVLRSSTTLLVNEEGTKVRRRLPLPPTLDKDILNSRTLAAVNVPLHQATMASLATLFGTYGAVASLQVFRPKPGGGVAPELQPLLPRVSEVATTTCAVVEYEDIWGADHAFHELVNPPMTLYVLHRSRRGSLQSNRTLATTTVTSRGRRRSESGVSAEQLRQRLNGGVGKQQQTRTVESSASDCDEAGSRHTWWRHGPRRATRQFFPRISYHAPVGNSISMPASPASFRRAGNSTRIIRAPRGPDGTRGFFTNSTPLQEFADNLVANGPSESHV